jgi:hypothetical protein
MQMPTLNEQSDSSPLGSLFNRIIGKTYICNYTKTLYSKIVNMLKRKPYLMKTLNCTLIDPRSRDLITILTINTPRRKTLKIVFENDKLFFKSDEAVILLGQTQEINELTIDFCSHKIVIELNYEIHSVNTRSCIYPPVKTDFSLLFENMSCYKIANFEFE